MRIGIDASRAFVDQPTGTERYAFEMITRMLRLPEAKKHTWILYLKKDQSLILNNQSLGSHVLGVEIPLTYLWTQVGLAVRTWLDRMDVLWIPAHTLPVLRKPGIKTVVTIHGIEYEWLPAYENRLQRWYLPLSTRYAVARADRIIAVSEFTKRQLVQRLGAEGQKITVVGEGYTSPGLRYDQGETTEKGGAGKVLKKFDLKPKRYILFVGTVQPRKNLERLVEAFSKLSLDQVRGDELKLVIAGKLGWSYTKILEAPGKWGVKERVIFCGYVDDYTRQVLLNNSLVYVQPSITEGFGIPVLEAMVSGIPVVSSSGGALTEVVGEAGLLFDPYSVGDIFRRMSAVIKDEKLRKSLVNKGKEQVKKFNWKDSVISSLKLIVYEDNGIL